MVVDRDAVVLMFDDGEIGRFHPIWLRDACRCAQCRIPGSLRRVAEAMTIPTDLVVRSASLVEHGTVLRLDWPDDHQSDITGDFLRGRLAVESPSSERTRGRTVWAAERTDDIPMFDHVDIIGSERGELRWLETIDDLGFAIVTNVPRSREALAALASSIGPIRASNYGTDWEIEATVMPKNAVYSARGLSAHTDLPYRETPPGLQFLLCDVSDAPGGASTLVDGYRVAEQLRADAPEVWCTLTEENVSYSYVDGQYDLRWSGPILGLRRDGSYGVIRHAPGLQGPLAPDPNVFTRTYGAIHRWTTMLNDPGYQLSIRLAPGELLVLDNHRVLHGREAFDLGAGGRRHMLGSYIDIDDLRSRIRTLRRSVGSASSDQVGTDEIQSGETAPMR